MTDASADRPHDESRVPSLWVEKLALGELSDDEARDVRARLGDAASERLSALAHSDEQILREHPPSRVAAQIERRLERLESPAASHSPRWMVWAPAVAAAGLALVWWIGREDSAASITDPDEPATIARVEPPAPPGAKGLESSAPEQIILKGDPVLMIDRIREGRIQRMAADTRVGSGDRLQITYNAKGAQQGVVVSVDGAGVATLHFPATPTDPPRLDHGGPVPLPQSYELDDAPGFERFLFVTVDNADALLDVARVMDAARDLARGDDARDGALALPGGWRQQSILLLK